VPNKQFVSESEKTVHTKRGKRPKNTLVGERGSAGDPRSFDLTAARTLREFPGVAIFFDQLNDVPVLISPSWRNQQDRGRLATQLGVTKQQISKDLLNVNSVDNQRNDQQRFECCRGQQSKT
jgi:hypothetical protein